MAEVILPPEELEPELPEEQLPEVEKPTEKSKVISVNFSPLNTKQTENLDTRETFFTTDTDAWIVLKIDDMSEPTGQYSLALMNKQDGSIFQRTGDIVNGAAYYKLLPNEIKHAGRWFGQAVITLPNGQTTASRFIFTVSGHILDGKDVREIVIQDFQTLMKQLNDLKDNEANEFGLLKSEIEDFQTIAQENENERKSAELERVAAEIRREESYESKVDAAIVEADVVEKVDNKVAELSPAIQEVAAQLAQTGQLDFFIPDLQESYYANNFSLRSNDVYGWYDKFIGTYSDGYKVTKEVLGKDQSNTYDINKYVFEPENYDREIILSSGMHGIESTPVYTLYEMMKHTVQGTNSNALFNYLRKYVKVVVIPFVAPWGFNQSPRVYANVNGVNINRNLATQEKWDSLSSPASDIYEGKGTAPFSEVESRILSDQIALYKDTADFYLDLHTAAGYDASYFVITNPGDDEMYSALDSAVTFIKQYNKNHMNDIGAGIFSTTYNDFKLDYILKNYNLSCATVEMQPARYGNTANGQLDITNYMLHFSSYLIGSLNVFPKKKLNHSIAAESVKALESLSNKISILTKGHEGEVINTLNSVVGVSDHFDRVDNTSLGNTETGNLPWVVEPDVGGIELLNSSLQSKISTEFNYAYFDTGKSNFIIHADINLGNGNGAGISFRHKNLTAKIGIGNDGQKVELVDFLTPIASEPINLSGGQTYHMMLVALGERIMIYVDNVIYIDTNLSKYITGTHVGFRTFKDTESTLLNIDVKFVGGG